MTPASLPRLRGHFHKRCLAVGVHDQPHNVLRIALVSVALALRDYFVVVCAQTPVPILPGFVEFKSHVSPHE